MITFSEWGDFCKKLRGRGVTTLLARDFAMRENTDGKTVVIKHDVEAEPGKALKTAHVEAQNGVFSTFYFHGFFLRDPQAVSAMREIDELGHEVAYHYDVLDLNDGDYARALAEFETDLGRFAEIGTPISTVCPHGNPLKRRDGWNSNKDFFKDAAIREKFPAIFDIVNDVGSHAPNFSYISDAGYSFKVIGDIRDNDKVGEGIQGDREISVSDALDICEAGPDTVVSVHSHRMSRSRLALSIRRSIFMALRSVVRVLTRSSVFRRLLSPLFAFSKRF